MSLFKGSLLLLNSSQYLLNFGLLIKNLLDHLAGLLVHLAELLLEISVMSDVSLRRLLGLLSDAVQFFLKLCLKLSNSLLINFAHLADGAFPRAELILFIIIWGHYEEEPLSFLDDFVV